MTPPKAGVEQEVAEVPIGDPGHQIGIIGGGQIIPEANIIRIAFVRAILPAWRWLLWRPLVGCRATHKEGGKEVELHRVPGSGAAMAKEAGNGGQNKSQSQSKKATDGGMFNG